MINDHETSAIFLSVSSVSVCVASYCFRRVIGESRESVASCKLLIMAVFAAIIASSRKNAVVLS